MLVATKLDVVQLAAQLAELGALTGDLLAEESGREEDAAEDAGRSGRASTPDGSPRRRSREPDERADARDEAEREQRRRRACRRAAAASARSAARTRPTACRARRPECAQSPNFDLPAWRGYSGTGISGHAESLRRGDDDHVAVPVGTHGQRVHDLAAIRLHRVEVLHRHVEQRRGSGGCRCRRRTPSRTCPA